MNGAILGFGFDLGANYLKRGISKLDPNLILLNFEILGREEVFKPVTIIYTWEFYFIFQIRKMILFLECHTEVV